MRQTLVTSLYNEPHTRLLECYPSQAVHQVCEVISASQRPDSEGTGETSQVSKRRTEPKQRQGRTWKEPGLGGSKMRREKGRKHHDMELFKKGGGGGVSQVTKHEDSEMRTLETH